MKKMVRFIAISIHLILFTGCAAVPILVVEGTRAAINDSKNKFKDVEIVYRQGFDQSSIEKITSASFLVSEGGNNFFALGAGTTLSDNLAKEFLIKGMAVEEYTALENLLNQKNLGSDTSSVLEAAKLADIDAVFTGSVETGHDFNYGLFGINSGMQTGITGATLKLTDVKTKKIILIMAANYKKPKASKVVAADIAGAFFNQASDTQ